MKMYLKCSIMISLALLMAIGLANASPIGTPLQANPYESVPTVQAISTAPPTVTRTATASMMDGDLGTFGTVYAAGTTGTFYWLRFSGFGNTPPFGEFPITWVSLQIKYQHPLGMVDDQYRWEWSVDGVTWMQLTAPATGKFDSAGLPQVRSFSQLAEPTDGVWDWVDFGSIMVRYYVTRGATSFDGAGRPFRVYDLWISAYSTPVPPAASPTLSLQSPAITAQDAAYLDFFVEVYANDVTALAGWEYNIFFDPAVLLPTEYYNYYPWTDIAAPDVGPDYIHIDGTIPIADPLVNTGLSGGQAVARIYFMVNEDPANLGFPMPPNFSWLRLTVSKMGDPAATKIAHHTYHGYYGNPPADTYIMGSDPITAPISTTWVEQYPVPGNVYHLTSWDDNLDGILSPSDQVDMTPTVPPAPDPLWFHVEHVWEADTGLGFDAFMILTYKPPLPEFPLGIGVLLGLAPALPLIYLWRRRPKRRV